MLGHAVVVYKINNLFCLMVLREQFNLLFMAPVLGEWVFNTCNRHAKLFTFIAFKSSGMLNFKLK